METTRTGRWKNHPPHVALKCQICGSAFTVRPSRAKKAKFCSFHCKQKAAGMLGGTVRGEQIKQASKGIAYPKIKGRHAHIVIAEQKLGRKLFKGEIVHHTDENILNYHPDNIEVLVSQAEHMKRHRKQLLQARKEKHGY